MQYSVRHVLAGTLLALAACQPPPALYPPDSPPEIREACALTERRCTECHDHDRIVDARKNHDEWVNTVQRMREMPGSTIRPEETDTILQCLLYRNDHPPAVGSVSRSDLFVLKGYAISPKL